MITEIRKNTRMNLETIVKDRIGELSKLLEHARERKTIAFSSEDIESDSMGTLAKFPAKDGGVYLYRMSQMSPDVTPEMLCSKFRVASSGPWNMSRDNHMNRSSTVYVGTSRDLRSRFKTHLGIGEGRSTWGLYMSKWLVAGARFEVEYYRFPEESEGNVELIEGMLWERSKPLFGKRGGRNA